jgi:homoserine dehydrogenase
MNIAILGYGTIGKGVFEISKNNNQINVIKILERQEKFDLNYIDLFCSSIDDIVNNDDIELIVEVLGGYDFAKSCIVKALSNKKHVVTANKEIIAKDIDELLQLAEENNVPII